MGLRPLLLMSFLPVERPLFARSWNLEPLAMRGTLRAGGGPDHKESGSEGETYGIGALRTGGNGEQAHDGECIMDLPLSLPYSI